MVTDTNNGFIANIICPLHNKTKIDNYIDKPQGKMQKQNKNKLKISTDGTKEITFKQLTYF